MATLTSAYETLLQNNNNGKKDRFQSESRCSDTFSFDHGFQSYTDSFNISDINSYLRDTLFKNHIRYANSSNIRGDHLVVSFFFIKKKMLCLNFFSERFEM
jgi:hypothetical protein